VIVTVCGVVPVKSIDHVTPAAASVGADWPAVPAAVEVEPASPPGGDVTGDVDIVPPLGDVEVVAVVGAVADVVSLLWEEVEVVGAPAAVVDVVSGLDGEVVVEVAGAVATLAVPDVSAEVGSVVGVALSVGVVAVALASPAGSCTSK
jgi:hypothetical protein